VIPLEQLQPTRIGPGPTTHRRRAPSRGRRWAMAHYISLSSPYAAGKPSEARTAASVGARFLASCLAAHLDDRHLVAAAAGRPPKPVTQRLPSTRSPRAPPGLSSAGAGSSRRVIGKAEIGPMQRRTIDAAARSGARRGSCGSVAPPCLGKIDRICTWNGVAELVDGIEQAGIRQL